MKRSEIPFVSTVVESGADDRVYDGLLLTGPIVIVLVTVLDTTLGASGVAEALAIAYVAAFVGYVLFRGGRGS